MLPTVIKARILQHKRLRKQQKRKKHIKRVKYLQRKLDEISSLQSYWTFGGHHKKPSLLSGQPRSAITYRFARLGLDIQSIYRGRPKAPLFKGRNKCKYLFSTDDNGSWGYYDYDIYVHPSGWLYVTGVNDRTHSIMGASDEADYTHKFVRSYRVTKKYYVCKCGNIKCNCSKCKCDRGCSSVEVFFDYNDAIRAEMQEKNYKHKIMTKEDIDKLLNTGTVMYWTVLN